MFTAEEKQEIIELVSLVVDEFKKKNMLKKPSDSIYQDISQRLYGYYKYGESDPKMQNALSDFQEDIYFNIIPLFYKNKYTIDNIAEIMNCDTSTVVRNKKRLCMAIFLILQQEK